MPPASALQPRGLTLALIAVATRVAADREEWRMKRWTLIVLALIACSAVAAGGATAAPTPAQLQRQIKALQKQVSALEEDVTALEQDAATEEQCETVVPVARYGGFGGEGYVYATNNGNDLFMTSALDVVENTVGVDPDLFVWMLVVDNSCVVSSSSSRAQANAYRPAAATHGLLAKKATAHR